MTSVSHVLGLWEAQQCTRQRGELVNRHAQHARADVYLPRIRRGGICPPRKAWKFNSENRSARSASLIPPSWQTDELEKRLEFVPAISVGQTSSALTSIFPASSTLSFSNRQQSEAGLWKSRTNSITYLRTFRCDRPMPQSFPDITMHSLWMSRL